MYSNCNIFSLLSSRSVYKRVSTPAKNHASRRCISAHSECESPPLVLSLSLSLSPSLFLSPVLAYKWQKESRPREKRSFAIAKTQLYSLITLNSSTRLKTSSSLLYSYLYIFIFRNNFAAKNNILLLFDNHRVPI